MTDLERLGRHVGEQWKVDAGCHVSPVYSWGLDIPEPEILPSGAKVYVFSSAEGRGMQHWYDTVGRANGWEGVTGVQREGHRPEGQQLRESDGDETTSG